MRGITAKTGNAKTEKLGHTASSRFGRDERVQVKGDKSVRDQSAK